MIKWFKRWKDARLIRERMKNVLLYHSNLDKPVFPFTTTLTTEKVRLSGDTAVRVVGWMRFAIRQGNEWVTVFEYNNNCIPALRIFRKGHWQTELMLLDDEATLYRLRKSEEKRKENDKADTERFLEIDDANLFK